MTMITKIVKYFMTHTRWVLKTANTCSLIEPNLSLGIRVKFYDMIKVEINVKYTYSFIL